MGMLGGSGWNKRGSTVASWRGAESGVVDWGEARAGRRWAECIQKMQRFPLKVPSREASTIDLHKWTCN